MSFFVLILVFVSVFFLQEPHAFAQSAKVRIPGGGSMTISARNSDRDFEKGTMTLTGGVQIIYGLQYLSCDQAIINEKTQEVEAVGNLVISSPTAYVEGDRALLNYKTNTGIIYNGFVKSGQVVFEGKIIHKLGDQLYDAEQANFTACTTCPSAWTFKGTRIRAELGGYAKITNSILDVAGLPVFYLPYLIVPLKSERQTGLLMPLISFSGDGGPALGLSYFWAISRSQDATFTETAYSKRGFKEAFNYEYMLSATSSGRLNMGTVHDAVFAADPILFPSTTSVDPNGKKVIARDSGSKINRWFLTYQHNYDLPFDVTQRTNFNFVSDLRYPRDFPEEIAGQGDPALENRISLWHNTESTHSSLDLDYYINQIHLDPIAPNDDAVHRWPALNYSMVDHDIANSGVLFRMSTDYVNFTREGFAWDDAQKTVDAHGRTVYALDPKRTGLGANVFNPDVDVIRTGQRFDLQPELSYPFRIGSAVDILPQLQFRHTQYIFNIEPPTATVFNNTPFKEYARALVDMRTVFSHVYGTREVLLPPTALPSLDLGAAGLPIAPNHSNWTDLESQGVTNPVHPTLYRHEIQPELLLSGLPYQNKSRSPFFKADAEQPLFLVGQPVSDTDFYNNNSLQFDYYDRLYERNAATFALENKMIRKRWIGDTPDYKQVARVRLAQSYDFDEAQAPRDGRKFPWSDLSMLTDLRLDGFETYTLLQYFPYHGVTNSSSRARIFSKRGDFFEVNFTQTFLINLDASDSYKGRTENLGIGVGVDRKYFTLLTAINLDPTAFADKFGHTFSVKSKDRFNLSQSGEKGFTTDLIIKPPGNCWGLHATIVQNIGDKPTWHLNFEYKFGGDTQPAALPANAPSPGQPPERT